MAELSSYELSRNWFDWCFENPEKISPNDTALYFFIIEHCNRLGWKDKFGLPMEMAKDAIGISNYRTYSRSFNNLVDWGFIKLYEKSKNQYSANVIGLVKNTKASTKALSKAMQKHSQKQVHGIVCIDKPINQLTNEPINIRDQYFSDFINGSEIVEISRRKNISIHILLNQFEQFKEYANTEYLNYGKFVDHFRNWNRLNPHSENATMTLAQKLAKNISDREEYDRKTDPSKL